MTNASPAVRFRTIEPLRRMHADRVPYLMLERGVLRVDAHSFLFLQDENAFEIPGSLISCLLLGLGASVSLEAVKLAGENAILMLWVGEGCTRLYAASHYRPNPSRLPAFRRSAPSIAGLSRSDLQADLFVGAISGKQIVKLVEQLEEAHCVGTVVVHKKGIPGGVRIKNVGANRLRVVVDFDGVQLVKRL